MPVRFALALSLALAATASADTINFGDLTLAPGSYNNGSGGAGGFSSGGAFFNNSYNSTYGSWSGWSYSNVDNTTDPNYTNQYAAITGTAPAGNPTGIYAVAYMGNAFINLAAGHPIESMVVTNTTYTYLDVKNGDPYGFDTKYGPGDFLTLQVFGMAGLNGTGAQVGVVDVPLADFRDGKTFVLGSWQSVDLGALASAASLSFQLVASADHYSTYNGISYLNTPSYFALGDLTVGSASAVPEPGAIASLVLGAGLVGLGRWIGRARAALGPEAAERA